MVSGGLPCCRLGWTLLSPGGDVGTDKFERVLQINVNLHNETSADLWVQLGVGVDLISPNADLHDAVHVFLDQLVVVQDLHSSAGALRSAPLQRAQQRSSQVVQVVQVDRLLAAHAPAAAKRWRFNLQEQQWVQTSPGGVLTSSSCARPAPAQCASVYRWKSSCQASWENWGIGSCILAWAPQAARWRRWPISIAIETIIAIQWCHKFKSRIKDWNLVNTLHAFAYDPTM